MLVILLVVAALGLAACGSDEEPSAGPAQSTAATETQAAEPAASETKPEAAATEPSDGTKIVLGDSEFGEMLFDSKRPGDLHLRERSEG